MSDPISDPSADHTDRRTVTLTRAPALAPALARGALRSPFRRPRPDAGFDRTRLVLSGVRADPSWLAAYARVCGFPAGAESLPLPYPHLLGFPSAMRLMSGRDFPLPLLGLVHTSIEIVRHTALPATGTYDVAVHVAALAPHRRGTQATVVTELRDAERVVWESRSTYLARHRAATRPTEPPAEPKAPAPLPAVAEWRIPADTGRRYATVSGDRNPIHLHPLTARLFGFPRAVAHGMWTVARCAAAHAAPKAAVLRAEFRTPVLLPATAVYATDGKARFELRDEAHDHRRPYVTGEIHATPT
ncbi:MaoC/PaaZ C-terminal domain-containing protein [Streptomyces sp. V3I7]|uniref:MaoC/PaaZ C-terminal domain-containing protein n=1 Tax=Streptomyces sp. V3I7 TaxID=3042278 RepID=UPI00277F8482|nr:MaoC/PaaZ C-terminal domain-containing protein [Streptomyces sp. V3I7]MDQ0992369.1 acyl dehydratase [Streptomyces sp. V3I7]